MPHLDWITDVIADLREFAETNNMPETATWLVQASDAARKEMPSAALEPAPAKGDNFVLLSDFDNPAG